MPCWWNKTEKGKQKYSEKTLPQWHFVYHKPHVERPGIEPGPARWQPGDLTLEPSHCLKRCKKINLDIPDVFVTQNKRRNYRQSEIWYLRISRQTRTLPLYYVTVFAVCCHSTGNMQHSLNFPKNFFPLWHHLQICDPQNDVSNRRFVDTPLIEDIGFLCEYSGHRADLWPRGIRCRSAAASSWDCGFESRREHWYLSHVSVGSCQVEVSASGWSPVQRSTTECGMSESDREVLILRPTGGCGAMEKRNTYRIKNVLWCCRQSLMKFYFPPPVLPIMSKGLS